MNPLEFANVRGEKGVQKDSEIWGLDHSKGKVPATNRGETEGGAHWGRNENKFLFRGMLI